MTNHLGGAARKKWWQLVLIMSTEKPFRDHIFAFHLDAHHLSAKQCIKLPDEKKNDDSRVNEWINIVNVAKQNKLINKYIHSGVVQRVCYAATWS